MSVEKVMSRLIPASSYVLALFFLTGVWLIMSPFAMQSQPSNPTRWLPSTTNNVVVGTILMVVSLVGIVGYMIFALRDLVKEKQAEPVVDQAA